MSVHKGLDELEKLGLGQWLGECVSRKIVSTHVTHRDNPQFNLFPRKMVSNGHVFVNGMEEKLGG